MALEREVGAGPLIESRSLPGLFYDEDGRTWVRLIDGTVCLVDCSGGGGGAPANAEYLTLALDATLTDERVLTAGDALQLTDGGAGGAATLDVLVDGVTIQVNGFNQLESVGGGAPSGPAGGFLNGTYPNPDPPDEWTFDATVWAVASTKPEGIQLIASGLDDSFGVLNSARGAGQTDASFYVATYQTVAPEDSSFAQFSAIDQGGSYAQLYAQSGAGVGEEPFAVMNPGGGAGANAWVGLAAHNSWAIGNMTDVLVRVSRNGRLGFFGEAGTTEQTITGATPAAALDDLLSSLAGHGLLTDSSTFDASEVAVVTAPATDARNLIQPTLATVTPLTLRGFTAQADPLLLFEDSAGADLLAVSAAGSLLFGATGDVNLYRGAVDRLQTDDDLAVLGRTLIAAQGNQSINGLTLTETAGEILAFGDPVYFDSDGKVWRADANGTDTYPTIGIAGAAALADASVPVLVHGMARDDAWNWTVGGLVYLSTSAGLTQTQPSGTDEVIQIVGVAKDADRLYVAPDLFYITHT